MKISGIQLYIDGKKTCFHMSEQRIQAHFMDWQEIIAKIALFCVIVLNKFIIAKIAQISVIA